MKKKTQRARIGGTLLIALLCGALALIWPQWREQLEAYYGYVTHGPGTIPPGHLPVFPGSKVLVTGSNPVGMMKDAPTRYMYKIILDANFDATDVVLDEVSSLFTVRSANATCGVSEFVQDEKRNTTDISWDLGGCRNDVSQSLTVEMETTQRPGRRNAPPTYEPKSCGPLSLNEGAYLADPATFDALSKPSNALFVSACLDELDTRGCVDSDNDGWTSDCGDCDDSDPAVNPAAREVCGDGKDNDCDGRIDEGC